jgi:hypothetical protein
LWWTLRRRDHGGGLRRQPMNYEALRAVFKRVNTLLGTNYSMHDLRHTAALRMKRRGVASDATFRVRREDGAIGDSVPISHASIADRVWKVQVSRVYEDEVAAGDTMCHRVVLHHKTA